MSYITRFIYGTDKLRPNGFEVRGANGVSSGVIFCDDQTILNQWIKLITENVQILFQLQVSGLLFALRFENIMDGENQLIFVYYIILSVLPN